MHAVPKHRIGPAHRSDQALCIGINEQLVRIEPVPILRLIRSVRPKSIDEAGHRIGQVAVPDFIRAFRQIVSLTFLSPRRVEYAELNARGVMGKNGEVDAKTVPTGTEGIWIADIQPVRQCRHYRPSGARTIAP